MKAAKGVPEAPRSKLPEGYLTPAMRQANAAAAAAASAEATAEGELAGGEDTWASDQGVASMEPQEEEQQLQQPMEPEGPEPDLVYYHARHQVCGLHGHDPAAARGCSACNGVSLPLLTAVHALYRTGWTRCSCGSLGRSSAARTR